MSFARHFAWCLAFHVAFTNGAISAERSCLASKFEKGPCPSPTCHPQGQNQQKGKAKSCEVAAAPSRECHTPTIVESDDRWLVLSMHHQGHKERQSTGVLLGMREALHESQMVAGSTTETEIHEPTNGRSEAQNAEATTQESNGVGCRRAGTIWDQPERTRTGTAEYIPKDTKFDRGVSSPSSSCRRHPGQACEDRPTPEDERNAGSNGESWDRQSCFDGKHESSAKGSWGFPTAEPVNHTQNSDPADKSRESQRCVQDPTCSPRCSMGTMERIHVEQVHGAGSPLQGKEGSVDDEATGVQRQSGNRQGEPEVSSQLFNSRRSRTTIAGFRTFSASEYVPELQARSAHRCFRRRGRGHGHVWRSTKTEGRQDPVGDSSSGRRCGIAHQKTQRREVKGKRVQFNDKVKVIIYDGKEDFDIEVQINQFPRWRCKPWALYGGAFTLEMQVKIARLLQPAASTSTAAKEETNERRTANAKDSKTACVLETDVDEGSVTSICTYGLA